MADDKKVAPSHVWHPIEIFVVLVIFAALASTIINGITTYLSTSELSFFGIPFSSFKDFFVNNRLLLQFLSIAFSFGAMSGIIILSHLKGEIVVAERAKLFPMGDSYEGASVPEPDSTLKEVWQKIVEMAESNVESNWRVAIIEADIILDDLLYKLRLPGDTMGEKLKAVEPSDFLTLDAAWEAHKVRNQIAHGGKDFTLTQREARRVVSLYEKVFKEFYLI